MKKIIFIVLLSFMSALGYSQLLEDFEGTTTPDASGDWVLPSGTWKVFDNGVGTFESWSAISAPVLVYQGTGRSAFIDRENVEAGNTSEDWLVTPRKFIRPNEQLRFFTRQAYIGSDITRYEVRVSTNDDPTLKSAYTTIKTYTEAELNASPIPYDEYNEKIINLTAQNGQNLYIAFVKIYEQTNDLLGGDGWLIDHVQLSLECLVPTLPRITTLRSTSAVIAWNNPGGATEFEVEYGLFGFQLGTGTRVTPNPTTPSAEITGLTPDTQYQYYVRAKCDTGATSVWSNTGFIQTLNIGALCTEPMIVTPLPFSDQSNTLEYGNYVGTSIPGSANSCGASGNYLASLDAVYSYTADETGLISISMNPFGVTNTGVFVYDSCASIGVGCLAGVGNTNGSIRNIPNFSVVAGRTYLIVVSSRDLTFNFEYLLLIQKVTCDAPVTQTAVPHMTSADLSWTMTSGSITSGWQVAVQPRGGSVPAAGDDIRTVTTNPTYTWEGLAAGTNYQYWVRADCGNGTYSGWTGPYLFSTDLCEAADKCNYKFTLRDTFGDGWEGGRMEVRQNGVVVATLGSTLTTGGPVVVNVPLCSGTPFELFWSVAGNSPNEVRISVENSFNQVLYAITTNSAFLINQSLYTGMVNCTEQSCLPPTNIAVTTTTITARTATVTWTSPGAPAGSWEVYVRPLGQPAPGPTSTPDYTVSVPSVNLIGLNPEGTYAVYVRSVCSVSSPSVWGGPMTFTTLATCPIPTALLVDQIGPRTARLKWTNAGGTAINGWQVIVLPAGSTPPASDDPRWVAAPTNPFVYNTGLEPDTSYDFYVRGDCGPENGLSSIAGPRNFVTTSTCPRPTALLVDQITTTSARMRWSSTANTAESFQVIAVLAGSPAPTATETGWRLGTSPFIYTGLTPDTDYEYYVRSNCGTVNGLSLWTGPRAFATLPTCPRPTNLTAPVATRTNTSIRIDWNNNGATASSWHVFALPCGSPVPTAESTGYITADQKPYTITGLTPDTCYDIYIRSVCGDADFSRWLGITNIFTALTPPACGGFFTDLGGATRDYPSSANSTLTICPTNPGDIVKVTFTSFATEEEFDGLYVYDGSSTTAAALIPSDNGPGNGNLTAAGAFWGNDALPGPFTSTAPDGCLTFRFVSDGSGTDTGWIANVTCLPAPTCPRPRALTSANIPAGGVRLGWTEAGTASSWQVIVQPAAQLPPADNAVGIPTNTNSYIANGLAPGVLYSFYVRAICSSTDDSDWSGPFRFGTRPVNDECANASLAIVNQNLNCIQTVPGTLIGATGSTQNSTCGAVNDDVWFTFTATSQSHIISFTDVSLENTTLQYAIFRGNVCGSLTQVGACNNAGNLVPGTVYYIRVSSVQTLPQYVNFNLCIGTLPCSEAPAFCTGQTVTYANAVDVPSLGTIGCLSSTPNPAFFFLQVNQAGPLSYLISQVDGNGAGLDVDYVAWGPFPDLNVACNAIPNNPMPRATPYPTPATGCPGTVHACSYAADPQEIMCLPDAQLCEVYVLMITNFSNRSGMITFTQTNTGGGTTACFPINIFNYPQNTYCQEAADPRPVLAPGAVAGVYSATPAGLVIDPVTGIIDLSASAPGSYQVTATTMTSTEGACTNIPSITTTRTVIVTQSPNSPDFPTTITYNNGNPAIFCNGIDTPQEVTRVGISGGTYGLAEGLTGLSIDTYSGNIVPSGSTPGTYQVIYTIPAQGGCPSAFRETTVTILEAPQIEQPANVPACGSFELPLLTVGNYYAQSGGPANGPILTGPITTEQTVYIYADNGTCSAEKSFLVRIVPLPQTPVATVTNPTCSVPTGGAEVISPVGTTAVIRNNLFISEVTDATTGSLTYVEIFNGTANPVNLANYKLRFYNNGNTFTSTNCDFTLNGTLAVNGVYVVAVGSNANQGGVVPNQVVSTCGGINIDDHIKLTTASDVVVDVWGRDDGVVFTPDNATGYVYRRLVTATAPSLTWDPNDWTALDPEAYDNVGTYTLPPVTSSYEYSVDGVTYQTSTTFTGLTPGNHDVFVRDIASGCVSLPYTITVGPDPSRPTVTAFTYTQAAVCQDAGISLTPDTTAAGFTTGGTYTITPTTGLVIDPTTGIITIAGSTPGTYIVKYEVLANTALCQAYGTSSFTITVSPIAANPVTAITYPTSACQNFGIITPDTTAAGFTTGGQYTYNLTTGLSLNATTGAIDLNQSQPGTYIITYTVAANATLCRAQGATPFTFTVKPETTVVDTFLYETPVCLALGTVLPDTSATGFTTGGVYSSTTGLTINPATGEIDLRTSTLGTYVVKYTIAEDALTCRPASEESATIVYTTSGCTIQKGISPKGIGAGDNKNDFLDLEGANVSKLEIFNRYGTKVYSLGNYKNQWYGQSDKGEELPDGTYYYVIEYAGGAPTDTGWIYINREK